MLFQNPLTHKSAVHALCCHICTRGRRRYNEAVETYEEGLKMSPGDQALGRGLQDVRKAQQERNTAPPGESFGLNKLLTLTSQPNSRLSLRPGDD